jgi:hypothetical protein
MWVLDVRWKAVCAERRRRQRRDGTVKMEASNLAVRCACVCSLAAVCVPVDHPPGGNLAAAAPLPPEEDELCL